MKLESCGMCCAVFSAIAIVILLIIHFVLESGSDSIEVDESRTSYDKAATSALGAAAIYLGFFILSLGCIVYKRAQDEDGVEAAPLLQDIDD